MMWELEDETNYNPAPPPPPPLPHRLDQATPEIRQLFNDILKYRVDPNGEYHGVTIAELIKVLHSIDNGNVAAIATESGDNKFKEKGHMYDPIMQSFIQGAGGRISTWVKEEYNMTPVLLRGITKRKQMNACCAVGRDFYYMDTGYFGNGKKKTYHRITRNDVQNFGPVLDRPSDRWDKIGHNLRKFTPGSKILLAPPSQKLLNLYDIQLDEWLESTVEEIKKHTDREIVTRLKQGRSVRVNDDTMEMALDRDIHCLVTFSSIAATEALLYGKPAFTLGPNAAAALCLQDLSKIEKPYIPDLDEVHAWASHLAYCQFTEIDMRDGIAWSILNDGYDVKSNRISCA